MVERQLRRRDIDDERVLEAMERVPRELFVPERERRRAYDDAALPIGRGQTISQPYMVARIGEALALRPASACSTSAPARATRPRCSPSSARTWSRSSGSRSSRSRRARTSPPPATTSTSWSATARSASPSSRPFDAIAVAAAAPAFPQTLYEQLRPRGRLVVPVGGQRAQRLELIVRSPEGPAVVHSVPCRFVPLVGEEGFRD